MTCTDCDWSDGMRREAESAVKVLEERLRESEKQLASDVTYQALQRARKDLEECQAAGTSRLMDELAKNRDLRADLAALESGMDNCGQRLEAAETRVRELELAAVALGRLREAAEKRAEEAWGERARDSALIHDLKDKLEAAERERDHLRDMLTMEQTAYRLSSNRCAQLEVALRLASKEAADNANGYLEQAERAEVAEATLREIASGAVSVPGSCGVKWTTRVPDDVAELARTGVSPNAKCVCGERADEHEGRLGPCGPCPRFEKAGPMLGPRPARDPDDEEMF